MKTAVLRENGQKNAGNMRKYGVGDRPEIRGGRQAGNTGWATGRKYGVGDRTRRFPCFLSAGDSPLLFKHFPKCICNSVSVTEKASNTLWTFPKELPNPLGTAQMASKWFQAYFPTCHGINLAFPEHFPRSGVFLFIKIKFENATEKFKNQQRIFS
jgi:hypothetical protein